MPRKLGRCEGRRVPSKEVATSWRLPSAMQTPVQRAGSSAQRDQLADKADAVPMKGKTWWDDMPIVLQRWQSMESCYFLFPALRVCGHERRNCPPRVVTASPSIREVCQPHKVDTPQT